MPLAAVFQWAQQSQQVVLILPHWPVQNRRQQRLPQVKCRRQRMQLELSRLLRVRQMPPATVPVMSSKIFHSSWALTCRHSISSRIFHLRTCSWCNLEPWLTITIKRHRRVWRVCVVMAPLQISLRSPIRQCRLMDVLLELITRVPFSRNKLPGQLDRRWWMQQWWIHRMHTFMERMSCPAVSSNFHKFIL